MRKRPVKSKLNNARIVPHDVVNKFFIKKGRLHLAGFDSETGETVWEKDAHKAVSFSKEEALRLKRVMEWHNPDETISVVKASEFNIVMRLQRYDGLVVYVRKFEKDGIYMCDLKRNAHRFKSLRTAKEIKKEYSKILQEAGYDKVEIVMLDE